MENRRRETRYRIRCNGTVAVDGRKFSMETVNISQGGVRITLDRPLMEGISISIALRLDDVLFDGPFVSAGHVVWCNEDMEAGFEAGVQLTPSKDMSKRIGTFLENRVAS
jgi:hypothetical protein